MPYFIRQISETRVLYEIYEADHERNLNYIDRDKREPLLTIQPDPKRAAVTEEFRPLTEMERIIFQSKNPELWSDRNGSDD
jgi:hypothetical protein